jgi:hypothetical protein
MGRPVGWFENRLLPWLETVVRGISEATKCGWRRSDTRQQCGGTTCYETQAAKHVEHIVNEELAVR